MIEQQVLGIKLGITLILGLWVCQVQAQQEEDPSPITISKVMSESVSPRIPAAGTVFSRNATQITAGIAGRLEWVAEPGDVIQVGQVVVRFDCEMLNLQREEQLALAERARVSMTMSTREAQRLESLRETFATSVTQLERIQAERDLATTELRIVQIRIRQTESQLQRCTVVAPFSGVVTERRQRAGEDVERSTVLAVMTDTQNLEVRASVPIRYLPRIVVGETVEVRMSEIQLQGRIRKVVPAADPMSQTFQVRVDLPDGAPKVVAAGQLVSVNLPLTGNAALTVPRDSIVLSQDGAFVMRINADDKAERVSIDVADTDGERIAVRGDLRAGDRIAVRGAESLENGRRVAVQTET